MYNIFMWMPLITGSEGNNSFFPKNLNVSQDKVEGKQRFKGEQ